MEMRYLFRQLVSARECSEQLLCNLKEVYSEQDVSRNVS